VTADREAAARRQQRQALQQLLVEMRRQRLSRRAFMLRAARLGCSSAAIGAFLQACNTSSPTPTPAATAGPIATRAGATPVAVSETPVAPRPVTVAGTPTRVSSPAATPNSTVPARRPVAQGAELGGAIPANAPLAATQNLNYPFVELARPDPARAVTTAEVQFVLNCWDGLLSANQLGDPRPAHAEKYEISLDGLTYTFTLRAGLKFSDGSPLTAHDYAWTWKRNLAPETAAEYAQLLYPLKGAEEYNTGKTGDPGSVQVMASDDTTLVVTLRAAAPYFLTLVTTWPYVPLQRAALEQHGERWTDAGNIVTAGQYAVQAWTHDQQLLLAADPQYWGGEPPLAQINCVLGQASAAAALAAYEQGALDVVTTLTPDDLRRVRTDPVLSNELYLLPASGTGFIVFDCTNAQSPVAKQAFRQAVYTALNRENLCASALNGQYLPATTLAPPGILGHLDQPVLPGNLRAGDQAQARQLLQAAGYQGEEIVYTHSDQPASAALAQAIQADLRAAGIAVRLDQLADANFAAWRAARQNQPFDFYVDGWFSDYEDPHNWYSVFFGDPTEDYWHTHYPQLPEGQHLRDLIRQADDQRDQAQRQAAFEQVERTLLADLPLVPLYRNQAALLVKPYVKGLVHTNLGHDLFGGVKVLDRSQV
jgi:oligopeptide transport system substrate-binding protein